MSAPQPTLFNYESIGSTLDEAQSLAKKTPTPFFIFAKAQTQGRGRQGRTWHSPEGNIYFTACLEAPLPPAQMALFTLYSALCITHGLNRLFKSDKIWLKWPNDLWIGRKKCAGVLAEAVTIRGVGKRLLLGMGLNLQTALPKELKGIATSLKATFKKLPRSGTLERLLCRETLRAYEKFIAGDHLDELFKLWELYGRLVGKTLSFEQNAEVLTGKVVGLANDGALCVKTVQGIIAVRSGEVTLSKFMRKPKS